MMLKGENYSAKDYCPSDDIFGEVTLTCMALSCIGNMERQESARVVSGNQCQPSQITVGKIQAP